uniref:Uncharacterized protein n=1 Tax=Octopus bimaculoides TaxID=37653 RepID=A0A0L8HE23_OCTBM
MQLVNSTKVEHRTISSPHHMAFPSTTKYDAIQFRGSLIKLLTNSSAFT